MSSYSSRDSWHYTFELLDSDGTPRYVGWGALDAKTGEPPWAKLWRLRRGDRSPLGQWLATLAEPPSVRMVLATAITRRLACWMATVRRRQLPGLLPALGRAVEWDGRWFPSVRALARETGIPRTSLRRLLARTVNSSRILTARETPESGRATDAAKSG